MNIKTPDYKAQAENLRQTLLNYIDCMQKIQDINEKLRKENEELKQKKVNCILESEDLKKTPELYKAIIYERDKKIFNQKVTIENLFKERDELKTKLADYEIGWTILKQQNEDARKENEELKAQYKKVNENTASLLAKIHELETILNIYEGRKHD